MLIAIFDNKHIISFVSDAICHLILMVADVFHYHFFTWVFRAINANHEYIISLKNKVKLFTNLKVEKKK